MRFGVVVFPGSNCDHDAYYALSVNAGFDTKYLWHKDTSIPNDIDCIVLPGGFSYGDYLRCGAIAQFSPIMKEVKSFAQKGKYVIGICNGFQILTESGLLPGALLRNESLNFICKDVYLNVVNENTVFTNELHKGDILKIPVAHGEGNYFADNDTIKSLEDNGQVIFRYCSQNGVISEQYNPNGSVNNIAGIISNNGNVLGMMPHPERHSDIQLGCNDGVNIFKSIARSLS
jgi:phosphoribosylformylglycinamidine synthase